MEVQPIRKKYDNGITYLFEDADIRQELEDHRIRKSIISSNIVTGNGTALMNDNISDYKVSCTFSRGSHTTGFDGISGKLIDEADRESMHGCLKMLWNKAWNEGYFASDWKQENKTPRLGPYMA